MPGFFKKQWLAAETISFTYFIWFCSAKLGTPSNSVFLTVSLLGYSAGAKNRVQGVLRGGRVAALCCAFFKKVPHDRIRSAYIGTVCIEGSRLSRAPLLTQIRVH